MRAHNTRTHLYKQRKIIGIVKFGMVTSGGGV